MVLLLLVIALNVLMGVLFKLYHRWGIHRLGAIVVNYWVCVAVGSLMVGQVPISGATLSQPWAVPSVILGFGFVVGFNLISWCTKHRGIATTTFAGKLSLVIPAVYALLLFPEEQFHWTKIVGIGLAFPALYLSTGNNKKAGEKKQQGLAGKKGLFANLGWGIVALFFLSGALDTGIAVLTRAYFLTESAHAIKLMSTVHLFAGAAFGGTAVLLYQQQRGTAPRIKRRTLLAGFLLGVPNYFSVYFLMRLLSEGPLQPSAALPVVNIAVVTIAVLLAIGAFGESGGARRWLGLLLAVSAIFLLSYIDIFG